MSGHRNIRVVNSGAGLAPVGGATDAQLTVTTANSAANIQKLYPNATHVFLTVSGAAVRAKFDGTNPTASAGAYLAVGFADVWPIARFAQAVFISTTGAAYVDYSVLA